VERVCTPGGLSHDSPSLRLAATVPKVHVYIDGDNFTIGCRDIYYSKPDYKALVRLIARECKATLGTVRYYDSTSSNPATQPRQQSFWEELKGKHIEVCLGRTESNYDGTFRQKECDVMLACDMLYDALTKQCDVLALVSGDTDFGHAIELVHKAGAQVWWIYLPSQSHLHRLLQLIPDEHRILVDDKRFRTIRQQQTYR